jgi:hypothetical protein
MDCEQAYFEPHTSYDYYDPPCDTNHPQQKSSQEEAADDERLEASTKEISTLEKKEKKIKQRIAYAKQKEEDIQCSAQHFAEIEDIGVATQSWPRLDSYPIDEPEVQVTLSHSPIQEEVDAEELTGIQKLKEEIKAYQAWLEREKEQSEEDTVSESSRRKLEGSSNNQSADQPLGRLTGRPMEELDSGPPATVSIDDFKHPEPVVSEVAVPKARVPFARRKLDLSIYAFDEPDDDDIIVEVSDVLIEAADDENTDGNEFARKPDYSKHRPRLRKVKSKEERSRLNQTKRLSSSISPLKRTHWNSGKRSRWRYRRKGNNLDFVNYVY